MKKKNIKAIIKCSMAFLMMSCSLSYAKLPVEYSTFLINGKQERLALADIEINGTAINKSTSNADPVIINSRTLVPVRALSEKLGYRVSWLEAAQKVTVQNDTKKIELVIGSNIAYINDKAVSVTDGVPAKIIDSYTYVPIRFITENMGLDIDYDVKLNKVRLNSNADSSLIFTAKNQAGTKAPISPSVSETSAPQSPSQTPWVPTDVNNFTGNKTSIDAVNKPNAPNVPVVNKPDAPTVPSVEKPNSSTDSTSKSTSGNRDKTIYILNITTAEGKDTLELSASGNLDFDYYYLSNPKRLQIKAKYAKLSDKDKDFFASKNRYINSECFDFLSASESDNTVTISLYIKENVNTDNLKIENNNTSLRISSLSNFQNPSQSQNKDDKNDLFVMNLDRKTGHITIKSNKAQGIFTKSDNIKISVPNDSVKHQTGTIGISSSLIGSINVEQHSGEYEILIPVKDRVSYTITKDSSGFMKINFEKRTRPVPLIILDPGHGGKDAGAVNSAMGSNEKTLNLQMVTKLTSELKKRGYQVVQTRYDDTFIELNELAAISNRNDPDIFISIHQNSADNKSASGIETYYHEPSNDSKILASSIYNSLISNTEAVRRGVKSAPFVVIKKTESPATLLEMGFISNDSECEKLMSDSYQNTLANAVADGVDRYFGR